MYVGHLSVQDFRSYAAASLDLEPGVTTLLGRNGAGKTNLVEALRYTATLGSHRVSTDAPLVRNGADQAVVRVAVVSEARRNLIEIEVSPGRANRARINRGPVNRVRDVLGLLRTVLFAPEDLALIKGDPGERRRFLDDLLVTRAPRWAAVRSDYDRILKQRTALLKSVAHVSRSARQNLPTLDVWDASLARTGAELLAGRLDLIEATRPWMRKAYDELAFPSATDPDGPRGSAHPCDLDYRSTVGDDLPRTADELEQRMSEALLASRASEIERGICLVGPHRDELRITLGSEGLPARGYASHGESWSLALALRLASYDLLRAEGGEPVLILDDVFAELDAGRRERLGRLLADAEQVIITAADEAYVPSSLNGRLVRVPQDVEPQDSLPQNSVPQHSVPHDPVPDS